MRLEAFRELLAEMGPLVPLHSITEFDEGPSWVGVVDEETFLLLDWLDSTHRVVLHADIGQLPDDGRTAMLERLLQYNASWRETGGLRVALDADGTLTLLLDLPYAGLDAAQLATMLGNFATAVGGWRAAIDAVPAAIDEAALAAPSPLDRTILRA